MLKILFLFEHFIDQCLRQNSDIIINYLNIFPIYKGAWVELWQDRRVRVKGLMYWLQSLGEYRSEVLGYKRTISKIMMSRKAIPNKYYIILLCAVSL